MYHQKTWSLAARSIGCWGICFALFASQSLTAAEIEAEFSLAAGRSDNINRSPVTPIDENISILGLDLDVLHASRKIDFSLRSSTNYVRYANDTYENEIIGGALGSFEYHMIEERLDWVIENSFGQQLRNPFTASTPDNRENVNFFSTGPRLTLPFGTRTFLETNLRYSDINYEIQPFDNTRKSISFDLRRLIREGQSLGLVVTAEKREVDNTMLTTDYDLYQAFLRYDYAVGRNIISIDAGTTELQIVGRKATGPVIRAEWTRELTPFSQFQLRLGTRYSDDGDVFRYYQSVTNDLRDTGDIESLGTPFKNDFGEISYRLERERTSFAVSFRSSREDYEDVTSLERTLNRFDMDVGRELSRRFFVNARASLGRRDFGARNQVDEDLRLSASLGYQINRSFNVSIEYRFNSRESTNDAIDYDENMAFLRIGYVPDWGQ